MRRAGHLIMTLRTGEARPHVPCQLDCLCGACRPAGRVDERSTDRVLQRLGGGARLAAVHHARRGLGRPGEQHVGYDDLEERLGLSRTYRLELADPDRDGDVVAALRALDVVESAAVQTLARAPMATLEQRATLTRADAEHPRERVRAAEAIAIEAGDERVTVAVIDTGLTLGHPEFQRRLLAGYDTVDLGMGRIAGGLALVGDSRGLDFTPHDETGHGSHVGGIIGAQGWRIPRGLGGRSLLLPIRVLAAARADANPSRVFGIGALPDIDLGLKVAVDLGADVCNLSLGTPESQLGDGAPKPHAAVVEYAIAHGCILVAASGNSGRRERFYPAAIPGVIAVGSVDANGARSEFTTWGEHLSISAPGEQIVSVGPNGYFASSGTSHAAPFVTGAAALLVARARRAGRRLTEPDVRRILTTSATPLGSGGFTPETGHGLLDAAAALRTLDDERRVPA